MIYEGFTSLNQNEIFSLREKHKSGNLVLKEGERIMNRKPIIGIVGKPQCDDVIWNKICVSNEIKDAINNNGGIAIGILPQSRIKEFVENKPFSYQNYYLDENSLKDLFQTIDMCDGIILEGGIVICDYEQEIA